MASKADPARAPEEPLYGPGHQELGLRPWDEHPRIDEELEPHELLQVPDVGHRLARGAALDEAIEASPPIVIERLVPMPEQAGPRPAQNEPHEHLGV